MLGNGRLEALCFDGSKRLAHIRGKLRKKVWINQGDIILLSLRDYQDEKGDVILKYSADEARSLKAYGELPESAKINETDTYGQGEDGDCNFEFDDDRDSSGDEEADGEGGKGKEIDIDDIDFRGIGAVASAEADHDGWGDGKKDCLLSQSRGFCTLLDESRETRQRFSLGPDDW